MLAFSLESAFLLVLFALLDVSFLMFSLCVVTWELGGMQTSREKLVSYLSKCTALQNQTAYLKNASKCVLYN